MPVIIKRPRAKIDLIEIWDYIADDSEARADAFIDRIDQKFRTLAQPPSLADCAMNWRQICGAFRLVGMSSITAPCPMALRSSAYCIAPAI